MAMAALSDASGASTPKRILVAAAVAEAGIANQLVDLVQQVL